MTARLIVGCALVCASTGCFCTLYRDLEPPAETSSTHAIARRSPAWRSFFYGWLPREIVVHAAAECGGATTVREIRTRDTPDAGAEDALSARARS